MSKRVILGPEERPESLKIGGFTVAVLASGHDTQGYEMFHTEGPAGTGPSPHSHPWDETFYVLNGPVTFGVGQEEIVAESGTFLNVPGDAIHWYRFGPETGSFVSVTSGTSAAPMYRDLAAIESPDKSLYIETAARHGQTRREDG
ncbi:MAG: cupin domain-containing protein [Acidimicrobiia bacterium]|nr:cupin domain-containing protein [Acidimicrobiia bacterium]